MVMGKIKDYGSLYIPQGKSLLASVSKINYKKIEIPHTRIYVRSHRGQGQKQLRINKSSKQWICKILVSLNLFTILCLTIYSSKYSSYNYYRVSNKDIFGLQPNLTLRRCNFPKLEPFAAEILPFIKAPELIKCHHEANVIGEIIFIQERGTRLLKQVKEIHGTCCYRPFYRVNDIESQVEHECTPITNNITELSEDHEFVEVFCHAGREDYQDGFAIVAQKPNLEEFLDKIDSAKNEETNGTQHRISVIILGIDATSHMNFIRMMPKSEKYLRKNLSAVVLNGYTKVAENTLPNVVPLLTGLTLEEFKTQCVPKKANIIHLDNCPFIWKWFSANGYRTSFAEDNVDISIFNMNWDQAFKKPPTDYYLRPFSVRMQNKQSSGDGYCYGTRLSFKVLLDNIENLAVTFKEAVKPLFQFTWATKLSHDNVNYLSLGDKPMLSSLKFLSKNGHLNNTVLIVMSDHGSRLDKIRETTQGQMEDRMPLLYIVLPPWFRHKYPQAFDNLNQNSNRLTSAFDIHKTLKDLMNLQYLNDLDNQNHAQPMIEDFLGNEKTARRPMSLFEKIPENRTCFLAGIPMHWCICHGKSPIDETSADVIDAVNYVVESLNYLLRNQWSCSTLYVHEITGAFSLDLEKSLENKLDKESIAVLLQVSFITNPGEATFEATVLRDSDSRWTLTEQVVRTNSYNGQSDCVQQEFKEFCFCKN